MLFGEYNPLKVVVSFRGVPLVGFMDGTFVSAERAEDAFSMAVGAGGDVARVANLNRTGSVTLTLQQVSPSNDILSDFARADELFGLNYGPLIVSDTNGSTLCVSEIAWIKKLPVVEYAKEHTGREWVFDCADLNIYAGGTIL